MRIVENRAEFRVCRAAFQKLGFVPTMGFLHDGHLSLVHQAKAECDHVAVSIFVNPTQFGPNEDLSRYPRDLPGDLAKLEAIGVDVVFVPPASEIYPADFATRVSVQHVTEPLEGAVRPGHFDGVATVVTKLLNIVQPTRAYFGQKDAQQVVVIRKLVSDLDMPVEIIVGATVREADGLAMSSRNVYLSATDRAAAPLLHRALKTADALYRSGTKDAGVLRAAVRAMLKEQPSLTLDYVSVADPDDLTELEQVSARGALVSLAARFGTTRLIDNIILPALAS